MELKLVLAFWLFCLLCIGFFKLAIHIVGHPSFRNSDGDVSTEVGFEEDSVGQVKSEFRYPTSDELDDPHVVQEKFTQ